jgi:hypothetical protein
MVFADATHLEERLSLETEALTLLTVYKETNNVRKV